MSQFGLKIKLPNGNVANRVLPVQIHDLDIDDIRECESMLGSFLRGIEFIYKEPGVNKPLASEDDENKNFNKTKYKIQLNKTANAIREIITGMMAVENVSAEENEEDSIAGEKSSDRLRPDLNSYVEGRPGFNRAAIDKHIGKTRENVKGMIWMGSAIFIIIAILFRLTPLSEYPFLKMTGY
ncbi:MAG: hypothetical protein U5L72_12115 [Bacteroidales bacterium]|nr:hypothetical protein [Bacteroidales bacterium]